MLVYLLWALVILLVLSAAFIGAGYYYSEVLIRPKRRTTLNSWPDQFNLAFDKVKFNTSDGLTLSGWFIPAPQESNKTIIFCHGWGTNRGDVLPHTHFLHELGFNLFYFDFRGSGESQGTICSIGYLEVRDLEAALEFLKSHKPEQAEILGVYGISMGASVAIYVASRHPEIRCVVSEATFSTYKLIVKRWAWAVMKIPYFPIIPIAIFFVRLKLKVDQEIFSPLYNVDKIAPRPIFFIHGGHDAAARPEESRRVFEKAGNPKEVWIVPGAPHGKCGETGGVEYRNRVGKFYQQYMA